MLLAVLEDDRIGLSCQAIEEAMLEEQQWLEGVGHYTWDRLAKLVPDISGHHIRSRCLKAFHVAQSFVYKK
eukprot:11219660-Lingulodinium_polyedra.AAC.1